MRQQKYIYMHVNTFAELCIVKWNYSNYKSDIARQVNQATKFLTLPFLHFYFIDSKLYKIRVKNTITTRSSIIFSPAHYGYIKIHRITANRSIFKLKLYKCDNFLIFVDLSI